MISKVYEFKVGFVIYMTRFECRILDSGELSKRFVVERNKVRSIEHLPRYRISVFILSAYKLKDYIRIRIIIYIIHCGVSVYFAYINVEAKSRS